MTPLSSVFGSGSRVKSPYLQLSALAAVENRKFTTRQRIEGSYSGRHQSRQRGGSGEFVDYREYAPGEDLRRLDWKVLARTGRTYIRLHQEETNLRCVLALDTSASMDFGATPPAARSDALSKQEYCRYLATAFSHIISAGQDQVGLALLGDQLAEYLPPRGTPTHLAQLQERIAEFQTQPSRMLAPALRTLFERLSGRGVLVLMSDWLNDDLDDSVRALRLFRHRHWEVILLHLIHPAEERLPEGGAFRFVGLEGEGTVDCTPEEIRDSYELQFARHIEAVRAVALAAGCDYRRVSTSVPYLQTVGTFLAERSA